MRPLSWMVVCGLGLLCSCASEPVTTQAIRIPYHVVIVPLADPFAERQDVETVPDVELRLDVEEFTESLKELLSERFSRVTVLEAEPGARLDDVAGELRELRADLVLDTELDYEREVVHGRNMRALANGVLFLLGGPFSWYFDDNTYEPTAQASFEFFDVNLLERNLERSPAGVRSSLVEMIRADAETLDMDLIDRTDRLGHYALSIVLPATFVASDADKVQRTVREDVKQSLFADLLSQLKPEKILTGERDVHLQWPYDLRRVGEELVLEGQLVLRRNALVEGYSSADLIVTSGGGALEDAVIELGEPVTRAVVRTQSMKVSVPESSLLRSNDGYFQLWLDEDTTGRRQSWSFGQGDVRAPSISSDDQGAEARVAGPGRDQG